MELLLKRFYFPGGTNGILSCNGKLQCYTIELPWLHNEPTHSCIPEGTYPLQMRYSEKHGLHVQVTRIPNRSNILFHPANNALTELQGCIAPVTLLTGEGNGYGSRKAFDPLRDLILAGLEKGSVYLTIKSNNYEDQTKVQATNAPVL